jgi:hypothetical protein
MENAIQILECHDEGLEVSYKLSILYLRSHAYYIPWFQAIAFRDRRALSLLVTFFQRTAQYAGTLLALHVETAQKTSNEQ